MCLHDDANIIHSRLEQLDICRLEENSQSLQAKMANHWMCLSLSTCQTLSAKRPVCMSQMFSIRSNLEETTLADLIRPSLNPSSSGEPTSSSTFGSSIGHGLRAPQNSCFIIHLANSAALVRLLLFTTESPITI